MRPEGLGIPAAVAKSVVNPPYRGLVKHFGKHPEDSEWCELYRPYSRAQCQIHVAKIRPKVQQKIPARMAEKKTVHDTNLVNPSGYSMALRQERQTQRAGLCQDTHHVYTPHGRICAAMVTPESVNDSPDLIGMIKMMPNGSGSAPGDAAYGGIKDCNAIRYSGRRPVIGP